MANISTLLLVLIILWEITNPVCTLYPQIDRLKLDFEFLFLANKQTLADKVWFEYQESDIVKQVFKAVEFFVYPGHEKLGKF